MEKFPVKKKNIFAFVRGFSSRYIYHKQEKKRLA